MIEALIGFAAVLVLAFMRMPLGVALGLVGVVGFTYLANFRAALSNAARLVIDAGQTYELSVVPLFILMGLFVNKGGLSRELYRAAYVFLGHMRGGLAMTTITACAMPDMIRLRLGKCRATGCNPMGCSDRRRPDLAIFSASSVFSAGYMTSTPPA